jgi:hypothetical protein
MPDSDEGEPGDTFSDIFRQFHMRSKQYYRGLAGKSSPFAVRPIELKMRFQQRISVISLAQYH